MDDSLPAKTKRTASTAICLEELNFMNDPQVGLTALAEHLNKQLDGTGVAISITSLKDHIASFQISVT